MTPTIPVHPQLWHGKQLIHPLKTIGTGHSPLDKALPGNGWPAGAVTELVCNVVACGELSLLLPALARLSQQDQRVVMIDPPWIPYPAALYSCGMALENLLLIRTRNRAESLWACEQVVRGMPAGAMLAWPDALSFGELRRLQLAARSTQKIVFLFRDQTAASTASPAVLRLQLDADDGDLRVSVLKCRGQRPVSSIRIRRPQLFQLPVPVAGTSGGVFSAGYANYADYKSEGKGSLMHARGQSKISKKSYYSQ